MPWSNSQGKENVGFLLHITFMCLSVRGQVVKIAGFLLKKRLKLHCTWIFLVTCINIKKWSSLQIWSPFLSNSWTCYLSCSSGMMFCVLEWGSDRIQFISAESTPGLWLILYLFLSGTTSVLTPLLEVKTWQDYRQIDRFSPGAVCPTCRTSGSTLLLSCTFEFIVHLFW